MTKAELIAALADMPDNAEVWLDSKDVATATNIVYYEFCNQIVIS